MMFKTIFVLSFINSHLYELYGRQDDLSSTQGMKMLALITQRTLSIRHNRFEGVDHSCTVSLLLLQE